jgi:pimeloyl-ACP methyl ester carboxylesterase
MRVVRVSGIGAAVMLAAALCGCTGQPALPRPLPGAPALTGQRPCPDAAGFSCATLTVPLDHSGGVAGTLALGVAVQAVAAAPHGVLLLLTGGPGQPGVPFAERLAQRLSPAAGGYRLVFFDQRGTGGGALDCPALQQQVGSSDLRVAAPGAVTACARQIGPDRRFFTTADTVSDIDMLRAALGARRLTLDGVSYGSYVAERYALVHPDRVSRLVLDSVVPQTGADPFEVANMQAAARVLRAACAAQHCGTDPAADLTAAIGRPYSGPVLLDALVELSVIAPSFTGVPAALHAAREGDPTPLQAIVGPVESGDQTTAGELSQGLHASTLCADTPLPWQPDTPLADRQGLLSRALAHLSPAKTAPFDLATAAGNGIVQGCLYWPPEPVHAPRTGGVLHMPVLLLEGGRDLSTTIAWARQEAAFAPASRLVVVADDGHSVQSRGMTAQVSAALGAFLQTGGS